TTPLWAATSLSRPSQALYSVACPSSHLCIAAGDPGILMSSAPQLAKPWRHARIPGHAQLQDVACPSNHLCVTAEDTADVLTSTQPADPRIAWKVHRADPSKPVDPLVDPVSIISIACPAATLCVAFDSYGNALTTNQPTHKSAAWRRSHADPSLDRLGNPAQVQITCPTIKLCVG